jgi:hypothetical protein
MGGEVIPVQGDVATKAGIVDFYDKASKHLDQVSWSVGCARTLLISIARFLGQQCWFL